MCEGYLALPWQDFDAVIVVQSLGRVRAHASPKSGGITHRAGILGRTWKRPIAAQQKFTEAEASSKD